MKLSGARWAPPFPESLSVALSIARPAAYCPSVGPTTLAGPRIRSGEWKHVGSPILGVIVPRHRNSYPKPPQHIRAMSSQWAVAAFPWSQITHSSIPSFCHSRRVNQPRYVSFRLPVPIRSRTSQSSIEHLAGAPSRPILTLFDPPFFPRQPSRTSDLADFVNAQDIIYVGGGNTANLLAMWRAHGLDELFRHAWSRGAILCGVSAGMICWFRGGVTDSYGSLVETELKTRFLGDCVEAGR